MKKFGIKPKPTTFTSLFNACANSPWKEDGLQRAFNLRQLVQEQDMELNIASYNAMVKAFAMCGDLVTAFAVVDEMIAANVKPDGATFSALLMVAVSDKPAGFRLAIEVYRFISTLTITLSLE